MNPTQPRNQDQEAIPKQTGEDIGAPEPLIPNTEPDRDRENGPLPEEETYERGSPETNTEP
jgi:hypothetical protein